MDGSVGTKGTVLDAIQAKNIDTDFISACGPLMMLKALDATYTKGYISLEARMACGLGACMGCVVKDKEGNISIDEIGKSNGRGAYICKNICRRLFF